jgi:hypothetical protein
MWITLCITLCKTTYPVYNFIYQTIFSGVSDDLAMGNMGQTWFVLYWGYGDRWFGKHKTPSKCLFLLGVMYYTRDQSYS